MYRLYNTELICSGKIKYYTLPPEDDTASVHLSSKIITEIGKEFDISSFETMEAETLTQLGTDQDKSNTSMLIESSGPVTAEEQEEKMEEDNAPAIANKTLVRIKILHESYQFDLSFVSC